MLNVTDYKNTADAKAADFERLEDIAGGQSHRQITQARLEELKLARGGALTLDNLEYGGRQAYMRPSGRGTTTGGRGGGNAGRGGGRSIPSAPRLVPMRWISTQLTVMNRDRPLDPAVDQSRPYVYGGKGSNRGGYQGTLTQSHVTKPAASSSTAPVGPRKAQPSKRGSHSTARQVRPWPPMALMENPVAPSTSSQAVNAGTTTGKTTSPSASSMMSPTPTLASTLAPQRYDTQGQRSIETRSRTYGQPNAGLAGTLDDVQAFMAAARKNFQVDDGAPASEPKAIIGFGKKEGTLPIPHSQPASGLTSEKLALLDRAGLRPTRQSPSKFTDGIRSNTDRSGVSPTGATEADLIGLGISGVDATDVDNSGTRSGVDNGASTSEDLMDMSVPEVVRDALVPESASEEGMVSIPKSEAEMWRSISGFLRKNDGAGMQRYLLQIVPQLHTVKETAQPTSHAAEVKANVVEQLEDLIGDRNLPIRSTASQTTPSLELGKSKWAAPTLKLGPAFGKASNQASKAKAQDRATGGRSTSFDS